MSKRATYRGWFGIAFTIATACGQNANRAAPQERRTVRSEESYPRPTTTTQSEGDVSPPPALLSVEDRTYTMDEARHFEMADITDDIIQGMTERHERRPIRWSIDNCEREPGGHRGDEIITKLAASTLNIVEISIVMCGVTDKGVAELMTSRIAPNLVALDLTYNMVSRRGAESIARAALPKLRSLDLTGNSLGALGAKALASGGPFPALEKLTLSDNSIRAEGAQAIAQSAALVVLTDLALGENFIGDTGARAIADSGRKLSNLDLLFDEIGDEGALALFNADALKGTKINLRENVMMSADGVLAPRRTILVDDQYKLVPEQIPKPLHPPCALDPALPEAVELRHMYFRSKETGFDFPIFMHTGRPYGNGSGRDFYWEEKAHLQVGALANASNTPPRRQIRETRTKELVTLKLSAVEGWVDIRAEFSFDPAYEPCFRPIANAVLASVHHEK